MVQQLLPLLTKCLWEFCGNRPCFVVIRRALDRTPANEMADVNLQDYAATSAEARFLIAYRNYVEKTRTANRTAPKVQPLKDSKGPPLIQDAFEQMEADYGSVSNYLVRELGVGAKDIAKLRTRYLD